MNPNKILLLAAGLLAAEVFTPSVHAQNFTFTAVAGGSQGAMDGSNTGAQFYNPTGLAADRSGNLYIADRDNNLIRKITASGTNWTVNTIAGGAPGSLNGTNSAAEFFGPTGITVDKTGNLYVADQYNSIIRKITLSGTNWIVTTVAGTAGVIGNQNGTNGGASFSDPTGIAVDGSGSLYVADEANNAIRKITPVGTNWVVTTIAGGTQGANDGTNTTAQFYRPFGVAVDSNGRIFVADQINNTIRLITPVGPNWVVTTIAGQSVSGFSNGVGTNAAFYAPLGVAVDTNENVYVADEVNNAIRKLVLTGTTWMVSTIGGGSSGSNNGTGASASFNLPFGVAVDSYGDVFVADSLNNAVRVGVAVGSVAPTGSAQVAITPPGAPTAGATWQLDGGVALRTNGAIVSGLAPGFHTINFTTATGYTTPAPQTVVVTARQTNLAAANYAVAVANAGSLEVLLSPSGSVIAGAQWKVDSGAWQTNGGIVAGLSVGSHSLSFYAISGWTTPANQVVPITNAQTTLQVGTYVLQTGSLLVTILPSNVVTSGAKWQVDGGPFQSGGFTLPGLLSGSHTISFNAVLGWVTPVNQTVIITNTLTTAAAATFFFAFPPQVAGAIAAGGNIQLVLSGQSGISYVVQSSSDLVGWTAISTNVMPAGGSMPLNDPNMNGYVRRFYRAFGQ
jgi:hypothetical protein